MRILHKQHGLVMIGAISLALLAITCRRDSNPVVPPDHRPFLTPADYGKVLLTLIDYDVVRITHQLGVDLRSANIVQMGIGTKDSAGYTQSLSARSAYDPAAHAYVVHFDFSLKMDSSRIVSPLTLRYYFEDSTHVDVDTVVLLYKFPYRSAEVFLPYSIAPQGIEFQDIAPGDTVFFFHPFGPEGLYEYNMRTGQTRLLLDYVSGDHIAAESLFVFCDVNHDHIRRYNLSLNTVDLVFPPFPTGSLAGLDAHGGFLYALVSTPGYHLNRYTFDGSLVDSIQYPRTTYYLTIHDGIAYSVEHDQPTDISHLSRFDLQTRTFLADVPAPWKWEDGIKVHGGLLYFCNFEKRFVGVMPVADLASSGSTDQESSKW